MTDLETLKKVFSMVDEKVIELGERVNEPDATKEDQDKYLNFVVLWYTLDYLIAMKRRRVNLEDSKNGVNPT